MNNEMTYLYAKDNQALQIPYDEYVELMKKMEEVDRIRSVRKNVLSDLQRHLNGGAMPKAEKVVESNTESDELHPAVDKVTAVLEEVTSIIEEAAPAEATPLNEDFAPVPEEPMTHDAATESTTPADMPETAGPVVEETSAEPDAEGDVEQVTAQPRSAVTELPPIKKEVADHFNRLDESGRLFSIFKQYYTCLNESCRGMVRVTMKDGVCSLWNYDAWEEFAFVDIFDGQLRIALDSFYTDALKSLSLCEVSRLVSNRRNVIGVQVSDLSNPVLEALVNAFERVEEKVKHSLKSGHE
jgi:hypothetical protein